MSVASFGIDASRAVDPAAYAVSGATPKHALKPANADEVAEVLRAAAVDDLKVLVWGGGVSLHMVAAPQRYDVAVDLSGLTRIVEYDPDDLTITAECGATLGALRRQVAPKNQELPLEGSRADVATLGGVLAANTSGPRRHRFGAPVDRILGARTALADGTLVQTGGKVVKNVAGYALHRLLCGAHGSLAVILQASIKLMPRPDVRRVLIYPCDPKEIVDAKRWLPFSRLGVSALSIVGRELARTLHIATPTPSDFVVIVGFEDAAVWVDEQTRRTISALGEPVARIDGDDVNEMWQALADLEEQPPPLLSFTTATHMPSAIAPLIDAELASSSVFHAPAGRLHVHIDPREAARAVAAMTSAGFECIAARGVDVKPGRDGVPSVSNVRAALRRALDAEGRFVALGPWRGVSAGSGTTP